jgi:hypothetical protein
MPWVRYRTHEEAELALLHRERGPALWKRIAELWAFSARLSPPRYPAGVYRYRSIDDAQRDRERWSAEQAARVRASRKR